MDTLAHGLWAYSIGKGAHLRERWLVLALMSAGPDLVWLPFTAFDFLTHKGIIFHTRPYELSHSLVIWLGISLQATLRWKKAFAWTWPWALHILIDIPGHIDLPTPFLWPISHYTIHGWFDWLTPKILLINYFSLAIIFFTLWLRDRKQKKLA